METLFKTIVHNYLKEDHVQRTNPELIEYREQTKDLDLGHIVSNVR